MADKPKAAAPENRWKHRRSSIAMPGAMPVFLKNPFSPARSNLCAGNSGKAASSPGIASCNETAGAAPADIVSLLQRGPTTS
ncbi:hypothetical protein [Agrobacterium deltaense]|uniref:hypothetical protein n=1 Tax=Agrobacterium deltaense TaxID=1183412 RepID=UPI0013C4F7D5|nr:hypothetical protein [Agrobacterium deltaense]